MNKELSENEVREMEGGWRLISDTFSNMHEDPLLEYLDDQCGICDTQDQFRSPSRTFKQFFDKEVVEKLCEWANKKAELLFAENST